MKTIILLIILLATFSAQGQSNPVIVELFTSQGCSSCPAADRNLTEILQQAKKDGNEVYGLSFHVDYWNYIGWKDPYSSKAFTQRQREYAAQMNLQSIYTPQMIVNGSNEFIGSSRDESKSAIRTALKQKPSYEIAIANLRWDQNKLSFQYSLDKKPTTGIIHAAIIEMDVENFVPRGENSGKKLHHDNVVKVFNTVELQEKGMFQIEVPSGDFKNASLIVYSQDAAMKVTGAVSKILTR